MSDRIRVSLSDIDRSQQGEIERALGHFGSSVDQVGDLVWDVDFETSLHSLAFAHSSDGVALSMAARPHLDVDGFEDWSISGPGELEISRSQLPTSAPAGSDGSNRVQIRHGLVA